MRTLYRTHFELSPKEGQPLDFASLREKITQWAQTRPKISNAPSVDVLSSDLPRSEVGENCFFETRSYDGDHGQAWGIRTSMPDEEPDISWVTETTLHRTPENSLWFSCTLLVGRQGETLSPVFRPPNNPGIVRAILDAAPGRGILPLGSKPIPCSSKDQVIDLLLRLLTSPSRRHPVVFVASDREGKTLIDVRKLAEQLAGLAYVIVAENDQVSLKLNEHLSDKHNCFNSGVRLYWPGFTTKCNPLAHPLWTRPKISQLNAKHPASLGFTILNRIASVSSFITSSTLVSWQKIMEWQRAEAIRKAKDNNQQDEMLELFEADNADLKAQIDQLREELSERAKEVNRFKSQADNYRAALESGGSETANRTLAENIGSVSEALDILAKEHPETLVLAWNSKSEAETSPYEDAPSVLEALRWVATTYHAARSGACPCPDLGLSLREQVEGWTFEPHQKKGTMSHPKHKAWYHTTHEGKTFTLPAHLKCGSTKDARHCIRIAFNWDAESQKVILGYLGQHQENSSS